MATCPSCAGSGGGLAFINRGPDIRKHSVEHVSCRTCGGTGAVTSAQLQRIAIGKAMRDERAALGKSLLQASAELGCNPAELSAWETTGEPVSEQRARKAKA